MAEVEKGGFVLYIKNIEQFNILTDVQAGQLIKGIFSYAKSRIEPNFEDGMVKMAFSFIKQYLDKDAEKWSETREKRVEAGRKGGKQKQTNAINAKQNIAKLSIDKHEQANQAVSESVSESDSVINNPPIVPQGDEPEPETDSFSKSFDDFWKAYPKKVSKANALKAWNKLKPNDDLVRKILSALEKQRQSSQWQKDNGQFIPYPATWINGRRWEDEQDEESSATPDYDYGTKGVDYL